MELLKKLNLVSTILKLEDLEIGKKYNILSAEFVKSNYHDNPQLKVKIELKKNNHGFVYLPSRFSNAVTENELEEFEI